MSKYTPEQVEQQADGLDRATVEVSFDGAGMTMAATTLRAYAATLRQQADQPEDARCPATYRREGAVKTLIGLGWKWNGQEWQAERSGVADLSNWQRHYSIGPTAMEALNNLLAPLLRTAPAEQGGRVDEDREKCRRIQENRDYWHGVAEQYRQELHDVKAALAQNTQGEDKARGFVQHIEHLEAALAELRETIAVYEAAAMGSEGVWFYQGDGYDFPETMACPVVMRADQFRELTASHAERARVPDSECPACGLAIPKTVECCPCGARLHSAAPSQPEDAGEVKP
jgi:hypothetical protein